MSEGLSALLIAIVAFFGTGVTAYFGYKGSQTYADKEAQEDLREQIKLLRIRVTDLETENKKLLEIVLDYQKKRTA